MTPINRSVATGPWPRRWLARRLQPTAVRPNGVTLASGALVLLAAGLIALRPDVDLVVHLATAFCLALALVLDTADGHLARLQGTSSDFGRWLDANLDECGDMLLHAAVAWSVFVRTDQPAWLLLGMLYGMGKYVFFVGNETWPAKGHDSTDFRTRSSFHACAPVETVRTLAHWIGHADIRLHLWIVLAALRVPRTRTHRLRRIFPDSGAGGGDPQEKGGGLWLTRRSRR